MGAFSQPFIDQWNRARDGIENTSFLAPGVGENNVPSTPSITHSWVNPGNIDTVASGDATLTTAGSGPFVLPYLRASDFGFSIPSTATITGIETEIVWGSSSSLFDVEEVKLAWGASAANLSTGNKAAGEAAGSSETTNYGGDADLWGETISTLTPALVNSSDFGFVLLLSKTSTSTLAARIDALRMKVYYDNTTVDGQVRVTQTEIMVLAKTIEPVFVTQTYLEAIISAPIVGVIPAGQRQAVAISS